MPRVLVVDDEAGVRESLRMLLKNNCEVVTTDGVDAALRALADTPPDLILLDLIMPGRTGLDLLDELAEAGSAIPVVMLTATKTLTSAVEAMKRGAVDYITKPFEPDALRIKVDQLLAHRALEEEVVRLRDEVSGRQRLGGLIGRSQAMLDVFHAVERVARVTATVLVTGESGTGKELVARAIHEQSPRAGGAFVAVNCGAIPDTLIESELFGHEKGAFTDAVSRRIGRFEAAHGGTLLLDEIGDLAPTVQVKLLRALQERVIERVGSSEPISVDVRVVAATNRDLEREVQIGRFRSDLFYRINVVPIHMPALRDRREDIRLLADSFLTERHTGHSVVLSADALAALEHYAWPGNVRELENAIEHGLALCDHKEIRATDLPAAIERSSETELLREEWRSGRVGFEEVVARFESQILRESLVRNEWNQTRTASELGITRRVLKIKIDRFELEPPEASGA